MDNDKTTLGKFAKVASEGFGAVHEVLEELIRRVERLEHIIAGDHEEE